MKNNSESKLIFISFSRVLAMFFVIFVHLCQQSDHVLIHGLAQFFITGVTIFILVTGYLYGLKAKNFNYPKTLSTWIINRMKKILIPYYCIIVIILLINKIFFNQDINFKHFFMFLFCIQDFCGSFFYQIDGVGHLWYITMITIIYCAILIMFTLRNKHKKSIFLIIVFLYIAQLFVTIFFNPKIGRYLFYLAICLTAYIYANRECNEKKYIKIKWIILTLITLLLWSTRFYIWINGYETETYNYLFVYYSQTVLSIWLIYTCYCLQYFRIVKKINIIKKLDMISYEVFLTHFVFIDGPIKIIGLFNNLMLESIIVILLSLITGITLKKICDFITNDNLIKKYITTNRLNIFNKK